MFLRVAQGVSPFLKITTSQLNADNTSHRSLNKCTHAVFTGRHQLFTSFGICLLLFTK